MTVIEEKREIYLRSPFAPESEPRVDQLRVEREDITFEDVAGGLVRVQVVVHNDGDRISKPTVMRLESAPLGAFVPWQPLAVLQLPAIGPRKSHAVSKDFERPRPAALGAFDRVPPQRLLTAVAAAGDSSAPRGYNTADELRMMLRDKTASSLPPAPTGILALRKWIELRRRVISARASQPTRAGFLAPDVLDLVGREHPHWAGNINVFVNVQPVERHRAQALRVYPGRPNLAMFVVGAPGKRDAYSFDLAGVSPDWRATLYDATNRETLLVNSASLPISPAQWVEASGMLLIMLGVRPPLGAGEGTLEVRVTRRSCQSTAVVEFNLDPASQGTGCYYA